MANDLLRALPIKTLLKNLLFSPTRSMKMADMRHDSCKISVFLVGEFFRRAAWPGCRRPPRDHSLYFAADRIRSDLQ